MQRSIQGRSVVYWAKSWVHRISFCPTVTAAVTMGVGGIWREDSKGLARIIPGSWGSQSSSKNKGGRNWWRRRFPSGHLHLLGDIQPFHHPQRASEHHWPFWWSLGSEEREDSVILLQIFLPSASHPPRHPTGKKIPARWKRNFKKKQRNTERKTFQILQSGCPLYFSSLRFEAGS